MDNIKKIITKINEPLTSTNFTNLLGIMFWLPVTISSVSVPIICIKDKPVWMPSGQGFNNLFDIYKFPLYLLAGSLAVITLRITLFRVNQTYEQIESSYRPILYLTYETIEFISKIKDTLGYFIFLSKGTDKSPSIGINNVGLGVARELRYHFEYDYNKIIEILQLNDNEDQFNFNESENLLQLKKDKLYLDFTPPDNIDTIINYLLPKSDSYEIYLPIDYLKLYIMYGALLCKETPALQQEEARDRHYNFIDKFPKLKLFISYIDLGNNETTKNYVFQFRDIMHVIGSPILHGKFIETNNSNTVIPIEIR